MTEDMVERGQSGRAGKRKRWKLFQRALARRKLVFRLVEFVGRSRRKVCEDARVLAMMCIGKMAGCVVLP
jgi:hypothetical protein